MTRQHRGHVDGEQHGGGRAEVGVARRGPARRAARSRRSTAAPRRRAAATVAPRPSRGRRNTARPVRTRAARAARLRDQRVQPRGARRQPGAQQRRRDEHRARAPRTARARTRAAPAGGRRTGPTVVNITAPRITSASTLSSVCETSVPSTAGRRSRGRPSRRATISAREGSPSRAGSVADISTPIDVPCMASAKRGRAAGSAALQDRVPGDGAQDHGRRTSARAPTSTQAGLEAHQRVADRVAGRCAASAT